MTKNARTEDSGLRTQSWSSSGVVVSPAGVTVWPCKLKSPVLKNCWGVHWLGLVTASRVTE